MVGCGRRKESRDGNERGREEKRRERKGFKCCIEKVKVGRKKVKNCKGREEKRKG